LLLSKPQKNLIKNELQNKKILVDKMKKKKLKKREKSQANCSETCKPELIYQTYNPLNYRLGLN
jgi:hypothetical protein